MNQLKKLFEPIKIGKMELKNRLVHLATHLGYGVNEYISDRFTNYYVERARGGVGLLILGLFTPCSVASATPRSVGIYHDRFIPSLRHLTDTLHSFDTKLAAQITIQYHWARDEGTPAEEVAPSAIATYRGVPPPRALTVDEVRQIVEQFGEATRIARDAGFDAVEFHCGVGYLINRFISPCTNKRTDEYGGNLEGRMRFLLDIINIAKKKAGNDYPILCRISAEEFMEGGHTLKESKLVAQFIERAGVHALNVQAGWHEAPVPTTSMSVPSGAWVYCAQGIKEVVSIPVIAGMRINSPLLAEQIIAEGKADLVGMARPLLTDPELPNKAREGRFDDIIPCIACNYCLNRTMGGEDMACAVNPRTGREGEYTIEPAPKPKEVIVIGGGPAGMEAAMVAAQRGHRVTLFEKEDRLGGQLLLASLPPYKEEISNLTNYLIRQVGKGGIRLRIGEEVTVKTFEEMNPGVVIVATGASPFIPNIPGVERDNVVTAPEVLSGSKQVEGDVIVAGGGQVGCETAEFLAEKGKQVTILEMLGRIANDVPRTSRWVLMQRLRKAGVRMETGVKVVEITDKGVRGIRNEASEFFPGGSVVLAMGVRSDNRLAKELEGKIASLHRIGDCVEPSLIADAIADGFRVACKI